MTASTLMLVTLTSSLLLFKIALLVFVVMFAAKFLIRGKKSFWSRPALSWMSFRHLAHK